MAKPIKFRRKKKYSCPNPLFEKWLMEWKESAASKGLKAQFTFGKALTSLRKYPLPLSSGKEAKILEYFGDKICFMLDEKLAQYRLEQATPDNPVKAEAVNASSSKSANTSEVKQTLSVQVSNEPCSPYILKHYESDCEDMPNSQCSVSAEESFILYPGSFDVILCVDSCETASGHGKTRKQFLDELKKHNIDFEIRKLNVGDFIWIAREKSALSNACNSNRELVLDYVVERKRMDDLSHSIKDGRFREQKFRLRNCGLRHPIYLVEYHSAHKYGGIPESTLEQAVVNTQVVDGFMIKRTHDIRESALYLSLMTKYLQKIFQVQVLKSRCRQAVENSLISNALLTFKDFNSTSVKNKRLTVSEMFAKHLLQFHGLSVDRAAAIVENFQAPCRLLEQFDQKPSEKQKIDMISSLKYGKYQKSVGHSLSVVLTNFYCTKGPLP